MEATHIEQRIILERAGVIDPGNVQDYIAHDGYTALRKALKLMQPADVIQQIIGAGLRGRGGAGFPTGTKWRFVAQTSSAQKYIVCNADESEPGTFKDRAILEGDPHSIIEAMAIAGYAVGASKGYIYIRGEYGLAQQRMQRAIKQAYAKGFLGKRILRTGFHFDLHVHSGAGAYICGEETALLESLEGKRGEPRSRPPFPTTVGLWGKPTVINNVETLANVPPIVRNGADWYRGFGTPNSPGTKIFTLIGNVNAPCLVEVSLGITLRELIDTHGKGIKNGSNFKMAQTGGSSGSVVPASLQDTPMDFDSFNRAGVSLGSGALLICDERTCAVDLARVSLNFFYNESCGKCPPCRIGTRQLLELVDRIRAGEGEPGDLAQLERLCLIVERGAFCGLGQTAPTAIKSTLKYFRDEYEAHIHDRQCPNHVCQTGSDQTW